MTKAKFIGKSDDFFKYLRTYTIIDSWMAPSFSIGTAPRDSLWVKFARESCTCPICGQEVQKEPIGQEPIERYRDVPYSSLDKFLENWEIIYD